MKARPNRVPEAGANAHSDVAHVADLMSSSVITISRSQTIAQAHDLMTKHKIHAIPVVNSEGEPIGVVTSTDLLERPKQETLVGQAMTKGTLTIPQYSGLHMAARMMRNHKIHHLIVTHEKKVVGIISSFDLLKLVEDRRFKMKSQPSRPKKGGGKRRKEEDAPSD